MGGLNGRASTMGLTPHVRLFEAASRRWPQASVGERPASAGWWKRATRGRFASPTTCHAARRRWSNRLTPPGSPPGCAGPQHRPTPTPTARVGRFPARDGPSGSTRGFAGRASTMGLTPHVRLGALTFAWGCAPPCRPGLALSLPNRMISLVSATGWCVATMPRHNRPISDSIWLATQPDRQHHTRASGCLKPSLSIATGC